MGRLPDHSRTKHELKELPQEFHQKVDRACTASKKVTPDNEINKRIKLTKWRVYFEL